MPYPLLVQHTVSWSGLGAALAEEVYRDLACRGIATPDRRVNVVLVRMLRLLGDYREAVDLVGYVGYPIQALAATDGVDAVLAVLAGGEVWLTSIEPDELVPVIIHLLPEAARRPVLLPVQGTHHRVCHEQRLRPGSFATGRFGLSGRARVPVFSALTWRDTDHGYYLVNEMDSPTPRPAAAGDIARRVRSLLSSFVSGVSAVR